MDDGLVLEHGTHSQLLRNPDGPYSRLVTAQKLRDRRDSDVETIEQAGASPDGAENRQEKFEDDLVHKTTGHTLASNMEQRKDVSEKEPGHNLFYVFMRMGKLNRASWLNYGFGAIAASRESLLNCNRVI